MAVSVGNTRTSFGAFAGKERLSLRSLPNSAMDAIVEGVLECAGVLRGERTAVVIADVNAALADTLVRAIEPRLEHELFRVGAGLPIPIEQATEAGAGTGQDRLLAALAAFEIAGQACVVIDAGTAVTVDFVDGVGAYQGGAITAGAQMMLDALARGTAQLPEVELGRPDPERHFGKNTREAMINGVCFGVRGAVRLLIERYAEAYGAYPQIIATGGDAHFLFDDDELVERIVDDLVLRGIVAAFQGTIARDGDEHIAPEVSLRASAIRDETS